MFTIGCCWDLWDLQVNFNLTVIMFYIYSTIFQKFNFYFGLLVIEIFIWSEILSLRSI